MSGEQGSLWFVTGVEAAETVEVVEGARSSEDVGGGFGSSLVQQTRKTLDPAGADQRRRSEARDRQSARRGR